MAYTDPVLSCINQHRPIVTIVDTPDIKESEGPDCVHGVEIGKIVKQWGPISAFVLIFKGTGNRLTDAIQEQLSFYEELFGTMNVFDRHFVFIYLISKDITFHISFCYHLYIL